MKQKRGIAMPFNWMFAIIAGIVILFLAIYGTAKFIETSEYRVSTETAAKLATLIEPMGTGLASGKSDQINFKKDARTYYGCSDLGVFGKNTIAFAEKTFGNKFGEKGGEINTKKYVFAESVIEGKQLNLFSKSFEMPFKVADIIVISGGDYCFYQEPNEIEDEVLGLGIKNINFSEDLGACAGIKVCFGSNLGCDISVYGMCEDYNCESLYDYGKVFRRSDVLYYTDSLLYAAIVSSPEIYECNLRRLMKRFNELSLIYIDKIKIIELKGCSSNIEADLREMMVLAKGLETSEDLFLISQKAEVVDAKNQGAVCRIY